jgi:hypothetical protein
MSKIAIVFFLTLGACTEIPLDAVVLESAGIDGTLRVWVPAHEDIYTINLEDFSGGQVPESALTCPTLAMYQGLPENQKFYFPAINGPEDWSPNSELDAHGVNVWTLKGCEHLNEFNNDRYGLGRDYLARVAQSAPKATPDDVPCNARGLVADVLLDTCQAYGDCGVYNRYLERNGACITESNFDHAPVDACANCTTDADCDGACGY